MKLRYLRRAFLALIGNSFRTEFNIDRRLYMTQSAGTCLKTLVLPSFLWLHIYSELLQNWQFSILIHLFQRNIKVSTYLSFLTWYTRPCIFWLWPISQASSLLLHNYSSFLTNKWYLTSLPPHSFACTFSFTCVFLLQHLVNSNSSFKIFGCQWPMICSFKHLLFYCLLGKLPNITV